MALALVWAETRIDVFFVILFSFQIEIGHNFSLEIFDFILLPTINCWTMNMLFDVESIQKFYDEDIYTCSCK